MAGWLVGWLAGWLTARSPDRKVAWRAPADLKARRLAPRPTTLLESRNAGDPEEREREAVGKGEHSDKGVLSPWSSETPRVMIRLAACFRLTARRLGCGWIRVGNFLKNLGVSKGKYRRDTSDSGLGILCLICTQQWILDTTHTNINVTLPIPANDRLYFIS